MWLQRCLHFSKSDINVTAATATQLSLKNCAPFTKCITKIDGATIDDVEDLDLAMPMYNLKEYSSNYSEKSGSSWFYSNDEATDSNGDIVNDKNFKSFKYKAKLLETTIAQAAPNEANRSLKNTIIAVPLKYVSNFGRSLEMPLINCKVELKLKWTKFLFCQQLVLVILMVMMTIIISFLLSKSQSYMFM